MATVYRFGPYELDSTCLELRKFGIRIRVERKPLRLLVALLEHSGEVVTRDELHRLLWADSVFVDFDRGLTVAAAKLRVALSDSSENPQYIETVRDEGYRFIAKVDRVITAAGPTSTSDVTCEHIAALPVDKTQAPALPIAKTTQRSQRFGNYPSFIAAAALISAAAMACALFLASSTFFRRTRQPQTLHSPKTMLVVLPFENLSGDASQEYLADGVTEELSARLGNLDPQRLGVIGRTSAMAYKGSKHTIMEIGNDLSVGYVLEGSVRREGAKIRITAQLVSVPDQAHVWAEDYDRQVSDLVQLEDEVSSDIAREVGASLAVAPRTSPSHQHIPTPEAHEAYLIGRFYWYKRTPEGWRKSKEYFRQAIAKDPQYAAAYAGLAECTPRDEALAAARRAVELDPTSGEAYTALGWAELFKAWDFVAAADALKTAIQLDVNYAPAHHIYSKVLYFSGDFQNAVEQEKEAVLLDPLALIFKASQAEELCASGQNDRAMEQIKQILAIDPHYSKAHETLAVIYLRRGLYKEAVREFNVSEQYGGEEPPGFLGYAYARSGNKDGALRKRSDLQRFQERSPSGATAYDLALVDMGLGNYEEAMDWLEKSYQQHDDDGLLFLKIDPIFADLRADPRFQQLLRRMKFPS